MAFQNSNLKIIATITILEKCNNKKKISPFPLRFKKKQHTHTHMNLNHCSTGYLHVSDSNIGSSADNTDFQYISVILKDVLIENI